VVTRGLFFGSAFIRERIVKTFKRKLSGLVVGLVLGAGLVAQAGATTVNLTADGQWHEFDVDSFNAVSGGLEWIDYTDGSALSFHIENTSAMLLTVVDAGFAGDTFSITDNGVALGATSAAGSNYPTSIGLDFDAALANPLYSKGTFLLAPGSHTISGSLLTSAVSEFGDIDATVGAVTLLAAPVPEPAQWATLVAGLFMFSFAHRARNSKK
jgi:hypothetical protein